MSIQEDIMGTIYAMLQSIKLQITTMANTRQEYR